MGGVAMKLMILGFLSVLTLTWGMVPAFAQGEKGAVVIISLRPGTYEYSVYTKKTLGGSVGGDVDTHGSAQRDPGAMTTTYIKIVEPPIDVGRSVSASAIGSIPFVGGVLSDLILNVSDSNMNQPGMIPVSPSSMLEALLADGGGNSGDLQLMKKGTVKFFNDEKIHKISGQLDGMTNKAYFVLPDEAKKLVAEALIISDRVVIIIETQAGKKGPNAVNVKLA